MKTWIKLVTLSVILAGCKKPYNPPAIAMSNAYLVVEGVINVGNTTSDSTLIKISRTVNVNKEPVKNPVKEAVVVVENDKNFTAILTEQTPGRYVLKNTRLDVNAKYRLRITTPDKMQYLSDFVAVSVTPPIDSVSFTTNNNQLQLLANTHDPANNTHYYRWEYAETWEFQAFYLSAFRGIGTTIVPRNPDSLVFNCWASDTSSTIIIGSSTKLKQDVISQQPLTAVVSSSEKVEIKYSILVKQYALSADAYNFYTNLKKNTEQLGSIFDAEPSEIAGNIHNIANSAEPVIGFISAATVQSKRIFIANNQLPHAWITKYPYGCHLDSLWYTNPKTGQNQVNDYLLGTPPAETPVVHFYVPSPPNDVGYLSTTDVCADCTVRGKNKKPDYWQ